MKESNTVANNEAMKLLKMKILLVSKRQCMKESNILANTATTKQLQRDHLADTIRLYIIP